jgi:SAM-dependent methyltransferase
MVEHYPTQRYDPFMALQRGASIAPNPTQQQRAAWLTRLCNGPGAVLDIGCSDGRFLCAMRAAGWACAGVEPNEAAAAFARETFGLNVITGDLLAWPPADQIGLITLWDVLEHTHAPAAVLKRAHALLRRPGWLALSLPNWGSLERQLFRERWIALDAPRHLYHFTPHTITQLLNQTGFAVRQFEATAPVLSLASNALRLGGDLTLRRGQARALDRRVGGPPAAPAPPGRLRHTLIGATHWLLTPANSVLNLLQRGASLTIIAQPQ